MMSLDFLSRRRAILLGIVGACVHFAQPAAAAAPKAKGGGNESGFMGSNQITASVMRHYRSVGIVQIDMGVVVANTAHRARAQAMGPILRDTWRTAAQEFTNSYMTPGKVPDAVILGQRMQAATDRILGAGVGKVVLLSLIAR